MNIFNAQLENHRINVSYCSNFPLKTASSIQEKMFYHRLGRVEVTTNELIDTIRLFDKDMNEMGDFHLYVNSFEEDFWNFMRGWKEVQESPF